MTDWWLIIHHGEAVHAWNIGDPDDTRREQLVLSARASVGFPAGDSWALDGNPKTQVMLTPGVPHPSLMARATVGTVADLDRRTDVTAYRTACAVANRSVRMDMARQALMALPPDERAAVVADLTNPRPTSGRT